MLPPLRQHADDVAWRLASAPHAVAVRQRDLKHECRHLGVFTEFGGCWSKFDSARQQVPVPLLCSWSKQREGTGTDRIAEPLNSVKNPFGEPRLLRLFVVEKLGDFAPEFLDLLRAGGEPHGVQQVFLLLSQF